MSKFKVGDKVVRIDSDFLSAKVGHVYTVERIPNVFSICLKEVVGEFVSDYFELVEQKEKEMTFKNMKFDVASIAKQLNVEHEEASRIIQEALFEQGYIRYGKVKHAAELSLSTVFSYTDGEVTCGYSSSRHEGHINSTIKPTYTVVEAARECGLLSLTERNITSKSWRKLCLF